MAEQTSFEVRRIKPLEWEQHERYSIASTPFGEYSIERYEESDGIGWQSCFQDGNIIGHYPTDLIAASACQKDFEQRVYSVIEWA